MNENSEGASSDWALTKRYENLTTDFTDSHRFFSLRSLRLCGSLFSQELK